MIALFLTSKAIANLFHVGMLFIVRFFFSVSDSIYSPALTADWPSKGSKNGRGRARAGQCNPEFNQVIAPLYTNQQQTASES